MDLELHLDALLLHVVVGFENRARLRVGNIDTRC